MKLTSLTLCLSTLGVLAYNDDGTCGPNFTCPQQSPCCSKHGYCGSTEFHCAPKYECQANCWPTDSPPAVPSTYGPPITPPAKAAKNTRQTKQDQKVAVTTLRQNYAAQHHGHFPEESFGVYVRCVDPGVVALTFDDGPSQHTIKLLEILEAEKVKATFFSLARNLDPVFSPNWKRNQQTLRELIKKGHLMGSHSYNHPNFVNVGVWEAEKDMNKADAIFKQVLGFYPRLMRPPEGAINEEIAKKLHDKGFFIINWNHDSDDWRYNMKVNTHTLTYVKENIPHKSKADSVIFLQHDTYEGTINIQQKVIKEFKAKGYKFVTVDECIGVKKPYRA